MPTVLPARDGPYACPCCAEMTLAERGGFEICPTCGWEDDGQDDANADDITGGPNGPISLTHARLNFTGTGCYGRVGHDAPPAPEAMTGILLVDDLRSFVDGRAAEIARTSNAGVRLLRRYRDQRLDQLWLDHDLGPDDTIWPVVQVLERAAFDGRPFDIGVVNIHSANPAGAAKMAQALRRWGYRATIASGSAEVGYLG